MNRNTLLTASFLLCVVAPVVVAPVTLAPVAVASDWLTLPSSFSHDPASGARVAQYAPIEAPTTAIASNFRTSGYTHTRSTLQYGQSADNYHRVEEWGDPVRPYGEWRFPYRPFSTPYPNWGQPFGGFNAGVNFNQFGPGFGGPGFGGPGFGGPGFGGPGFGGPGFNNPGYGQPGVGYPPNVPGPGFPGTSPNPFPPNNSYPPTGFPQPGYPGFQPGFGFPNPAAGTDLNAPYPAGRGTPYPVAPYYDGFYPNYRD